MHRSHHGFEFIDRFGAAFFHALIELVAPLVQWHRQQVPGLAFNKPLAGPGADDTPIVERDLDLVLLTRRQCLCADAAMCLK